LLAVVVVVDIAYRCPAEQFAAESPADSGKQGKFIHSVQSYGNIFFVCFCN